MKEMIDDYISDEFIPDILISVLTSDEDFTSSFDEQNIAFIYDSVSKEVFNIDILLFSHFISSFHIIK